MSLIKSLSLFGLIVFLFAQCNRKSNASLQTSEEDGIFIDTGEVIIAEVLPLDTIASPVEILPDTTLFFKRSGCYGDCPVFSYLILENGQSYYTGVSHVDKLGKYRAILSDIALASVDELAQGEQLWSKDTMYPNDINMWIMDLPTSTIILKKDGKRKIIANNHSAPESLIRFEKSLEAFISRQEFEKVVIPK